MVAGLMLWVLRGSGGGEPREKFGWLAVGRRGPRRKFRHGLRAGRSRRRNPFHPSPSPRSERATRATPRHGRQKPCPSPARGGPRPGPELVPSDSGERGTSPYGPPDPDGGSVCLGGCETGSSALKAIEQTTASPTEGRTAVSPGPQGTLR